jgi:hypothetical protein
MKTAHGWQSKQMLIKDTEQCQYIKVSSIGEDHQLGKYRVASSVDKDFPLLRQNRDHPQICQRYNSKSDRIDLALVPERVLHLRYWQRKQPLAHSRFSTIVAQK